MKVLLLCLLLPAFAHAEAPSFAPFQTILNKYLKEETKPTGFETSFDYQAAYSDSDVQKAVAEQKKILEAFNPGLLKGKEESTAFWINTYNFFMVAKIFKDGFKKGKLKINSVKDLGSLFNPYSAFKDRDFKVGGKKMHLDEIEKSTLLGKEYKKKGWKDARIHFAVNCASVGCPPLLQKIYTAENVDAALTENTKKAMMTLRHLQLQGSKLYMTRLFDWYESDFEDEEGSILKYAAKYIDDATMKEKVLKIKESNIKFIDYDWDLNRPENFK